MQGFAIACFSSWPFLINHPYEWASKSPSRTHTQTPECPVMLCSKDEVKLLSHVQLCNPMNLSGSSVHGILQARILEWVAISLSRG